MASGGQGGNAPPPAAAGLPARECESCRSAPGIPFCRVEWSFLCAGCAAVIHCHNYVVAVTPNPNPTPAPGPVVQVSSGEDEPSPSSGGRRGGLRRGTEKGPLRRAESVMRYREKRKSRMFEKTVRYETRKAYADSRPRVDGKFVRRESTETEASPSAERPVGAGGAGMTDGEVGEARGGDDSRQLGVDEEAAGPQ